jgi:hypothetical protein
MRDYKGSAQMTLRRRRRAPWGLITFLIIAAAALGAGYLIWERTDIFTSTSATAQPDRKKGIIPLEIPGQPQEKATSTAD